MNICDFKGPMYGGWNFRDGKFKYSILTEARKLTVGLVLGMFLVVAAAERAEGRPVPSAPQQADSEMMQNRQR